MTDYRIFIADDHMLFRQGIKRIIEEIDGYCVVGEANDGLELLGELGAAEVDLIILDLAMPRLGGFEVLPKIRERAPKVKILILSMHGNREYLLHAFSQGVSGYLLKEDADTELLRSIETIRTGKKYVSPILAQCLSEVEDGEKRGRGELLPGKLTQREKTILRMVAEGQSSKKISTLLFISERTVQNHRANIMRKLGLNTTADLVRFAIQEGLISKEA